MSILIYYAFCFRTNHFQMSSVSIFLNLLSNIQLFHQIKIYIKWTSGCNAYWILKYHFYTNFVFMSVLTNNQITCQFNT